MVRSVAAHKGSIKPSPLFLNFGPLLTSQGKQTSTDKYFLNILYPNPSSWLYLYSTFPHSLPLYEKKCITVYIKLILPSRLWILFPPTSREFVLSILFSLLLLHRINICEKSLPSKEQGSDNCPFTLYSSAVTSLFSHLYLLLDVLKELHVFIIPISYHHSFFNPQCSGVHIHPSSYTSFPEV